MSSFNKRAFPISGGMIRKTATKHLFFGKRRHPITPIHMKTIWTAPEGAV
jgi:hypothetical protein